MPVTSRCIGLSLMGFMIVAAATGWRSRGCAVAQTQKKPVFESLSLVSGKPAAAITEQTSQILVTMVYTN